MNHNKTLLASVDERPYTRKLRRFRKLFQLAVLTVFFSIPAAISLAQDAVTMNLDQVVQYALANSAEVKNSLLDIQNSKQEVKSIVASGLPQLNANGNFTHNVQIASMQLPDFISPAVYGVLINEGLLPQDRFRAGTPQTVQFGAPSSLTGSITLNQLVFDGTYFLGLKAAKEYVQLSELISKNTEAAIIETVKKAFYGALITQKNMHLVDESLTQITKSYSETMELQKAGYAEQLDVDRLLLSKKTLETRANNLKMQNEIMMQLLKVTIGMKLDRKLVLEGKVEDYLLQQNKNQDLNLTNRTEFNVLKQQMVMDSLNIKRYKVGYLPTLTLSATVQRNSFASSAPFHDLGKTWNPGTNYAFNLSIPIFDGFYKQAKISQAKIQIEKDKNMLDQLTNNLMFQVEQAKLNLKMQEKNVEIQTSSRELANSIYNTTLKKFNEGLATSFELVQAEADKTNTEIEYFNALYQQLLAQIELDKSLGQLKSK
ncbi:MAG: hypothetical protein GC181_14405 [Bacteroidetes bacterium]|nr:hypothetical protein [Bacteroidota bacterium]